MKAIAVILAFAGCAAPLGHAQLAITEVMTSAATNCAGAYTNHPDFWELTNYGDDPVDLTGYRFWDADAFDFASAVELEATTIAPGESIIFVRGQHTSVPNAAAFHAWWWGNDVPSSAVRVFIYRNNASQPGFDYEEDGIQLVDPNGNLIDRMDFSKAPPDQGIAFIPDPSGVPRGVPSELGVFNAFRSASCDDVGSPGEAPYGAIPLRVIEQPISQTIDAGGDVTFRIRTGGLPRPRGYQWYLNGTVLPATSAMSDSIPRLISVAGCGLAWQPVPTPSDLTIRNVQVGHAGEYFVVFTNGLERMTSAVATLTVNTNATSARIECPRDVSWLPTVHGGLETNLLVSTGQPARLEVFSRGYPPPTFQWSWSSNGASFVNLPDGTNRALTLDRVQPGDAGIYRIIVQNCYGTDEAYAKLAVAAKPNLKITEAMGLPCGPLQHDWWELTNSGDQPVNLAGYRWNDSPNNIGGGPTITNAIVLSPGESIILMESQAPESFRQWWGAENLPPNLRFVTYVANGLTDNGDSIRLWNHSAADKDDYVSNAIFGVSRRGASFWFDAEVCGHEFGIVSVPGTCGAFIAANGCDVGSPGWTRWTPPAFSSIRREGGRSHLEWKAQPGSTNRVQHTARLAGTGTLWTDLGIYSFAGATCTTTDTTIGPQQQRFYRLVRMSAADCPCPEQE